MTRFPNILRYVRKEMAAMNMETRVADRCLYRLDDIITNLLAARAGHSSWFGVTKWAQVHSGYLRALTPNLSTRPSEGALARLASRVDMDKLGTLSLA
jgi:hypothetical protein